MTLQFDIKEMKRIILLLLSVLCINYVFAQSDNGTNVSGEDAGWDDDTITGALPTVVNAIVVPRADKPVQINNDEAVYDLTGKRIETDDITTLPAGIYIRNGRKFMVQ